MTVKPINTLKEEYDENMTPVEWMIVGMLVVVAVVLIVIFL